MSGPHSTKAPLSTRVPFPSPTATAPPPKHINRIPLWLWSINYIVEWACALSPVLRVVSSNYQNQLIGGSSQSQGDAAAQQLMTSCILGWLRCSWWLFLSFRQRRWEFWKDFFVFDPVMARALVFSTAYAGILTNPGSAFYPLAIMTDYGFTFCLAGNVRIMLKYYAWTRRTANLYLLVRFFTPVLNIALGAWFVLSVAPGSARTLFVFYILCSINFGNDQWNKSLTSFNAIYPPAPVPPPVAKTVEEENPDPVGMEVRSWKARFQRYFNNDGPLTDREFAAVVFVELVQSSTPLYRLGQSEGDVLADSSGIISAAITALRVAFFMYMLWRQRKTWSGMWHSILINDNLTVRQAVICVAFCAILLEQENQANSAWIIPAILVEFMVEWTFMGHFRSMLTQYPWTLPRIKLYTINRLLAPVCFLLTVSIITLAGKVNQYGALLLYCTSGFHLYFDVFTRATLAPRPAEVAPSSHPAAPQSSGGANPIAPVGGPAERGSLTSSLAAVSNAVVGGVTYGMNLLTNTVNSGLNAPQGKRYDEIELEGTVEMHGTSTHYEFSGDTTDQAPDQRDGPDAGVDEEKRDDSALSRQDSDKTVVSVALASLSSPHVVKPAPPATPSAVAASTSSTGAPTPDGVVNQLTEREFFALIFMELVSSTYPVIRLINRNPLSDDASRSWTIVAIVVTFSLVRYVFFLFISWRIRGKNLLDYYFRIDNLTGRVFVVELAWSFWSVGLYSDWLKCLLVIVSGTLLDFTLAGNVRIMLHYYNWTPFKLWLYKLNRLYAPVFYVAVGVYFIQTEPASSGYRKNLFVLYLIFGHIYFNDLYVRTANTSIEPAKLAAYEERQRLIRIAHPDRNWKDYIRHLIAPKKYSFEPTLPSDSVATPAPTADTKV